MPEALNYTRAVTKDIQLMILPCRGLIALMSAMIIALGETGPENFKTIKTQKQVCRTPKARPTKNIESKALNYPEFKPKMTIN